MSGATVRCRFVASPKPAPGRSAPKVVRSPKPSGPSRSARMLALAHHISRLVEAGDLTGYAEAARILGLTRARLTQVMKLLLLSPEIQGQVLLGRLDWTERRLRQLVREASWSRQIAILAQPARAARSRVNGPLKA